MATSTVLNRKSCSISEVPYRLKFFCSAIRKNDPVFCELVINYELFYNFCPFYRNDLTRYVIFSAIFQLCISWIEVAYLQIFYNRFFQHLHCKGVRLCKFVRDRIMKIISNIIENMSIRGHLNSFPASLLLYVYVIG